MRDPAHKREAAAGDASARDHPIERGYIWEKKKIENEREKCLAKVGVDAFSNFEADADKIPQLPSYDAEAWASDNQ